jgi:hypothetical protein
MRLLLEAGTHFNEAKMPLEETPLHLACRLVSLLLCLISYCNRTCFSCCLYNPS